MKVKTHEVRVKVKIRTGKRQSHSKPKLKYKSTKKQKAIRKAQSQSNCTFADGLSKQKLDCPDAFLD